jgi:large subunit ribosomal protein L13|tara:strand:- start:533 stop:964 length:432 start_codon:yes stop_codon:yes gene_type:complete
MNNTFIPSSDYTQKKWYLVDATDKTLGRLSTEVANILQGKNKVNFYPSVDMGDYVIIINAEKIQVSGNKETQKLYRRHSGRPGGMKIETFKALKNRIPERILEKSVKGMLPKGPLGRKMFTRLKVVQGNTHNHTAQKPEIINL